MLINGTWQAVSGTNGIKIYPIIKKPSFNTSNSFLLSTDENILLVDSGADPEQMEDIKSIIRGQQQIHHRPVLVLLTHCHVDHWLQTFSDSEFCSMPGVRVAIQEIGAKYLEESNEEMTMADIMAMKLPLAKIHSPLLREQDIINGSGTNNEIVTWSTPHGFPFYSQSLRISSRDAATIYSIPGHSPDSICIVIGNILFAGDFFFALDYLVAGVNGWNRDQMQVSINNMLWLTGNSELEIFCNGHGNPLSREEALAKMNKMKVQIARMTHLNALTLDHLKEASAYSMELLEELNQTMAIIAGRLYTLAFYLEQLEESSRSEKYAAYLNFESIDSLMQGYNEFADLFSTGSLQDPVLVKKAGYLIGKIEKMLKNHDNDAAIDSYLFNRVQRSFADFIKITGGVPFEVEGELYDLNGLVAELLQEIQGTPGDDNILDMLENEDAYLDALVARIAFQPVFKDVKLNFTGEEGLSPVTLNKGRFSDALIGILEEIAAIDTKEIYMKTFRKVGDAPASPGEATSVLLKISCPGGILNHALNEKKQQLYARKFKLQQWAMTVENEGDGFAILLQFNG